MSTRFDELSRRLDDAFARIPQGDAMQWVMRSLLGLLSLGQPVSVEDLATATGLDVDELRRVVPALPSVELDDQGRIVGSGITLNPTPHRFIVDEPVLYTWCAMDTLIFPALLGKSARVESACHGTGERVRLRVTPGAVTSVDPAGSVVSIVTPSDMSAVRSSFCNHVHFFASEQAASGWLAEHSDATVVWITDAFELGRHLVAARFGDSDGAPCC
jgi:alkylmercury lyase